jgi:glycosyltransferase involved in cell wall biosynthesis
MVSVVMPVYNRVSWAVEALQSVLEQTYTNFEVVVVDDGSTEDPSPLRMEDERIRYVRQENGGPAAARNLGLSLARGRYVAFLDADDLFMPDKLEKQVARMEQRPDVAISHTSYQRVDREGKYAGDIRSGRYSGRVYPRIYTDSHNIATPTVMVRRDALDETLRFIESARYGQDVLFWIGLTKKSELLGIDEPLAKVRMHGQNAISNPDAQLTGTIALMRHGVAKDRDLPRLLRRRLLAGQNVAISQRYLKKREIAKALSHAFRAVAAWPFSLYIYEYLVVLAYKSVTLKAKRA